MELKATSLRRGYELLKLGHKQNMSTRAKGNGEVAVVSCTEEVGGGVVRMKIVVRKSELKQLVDQVMINGVKSTTMSVSSVEQRLNLLMKKKYLSRANRQNCWSPVLQSIPEEKLV